jgi:hypothetical protein
LRSLLHQHLEGKAREASKREILDLSPIFQVDHCNRGGQSRLREIAPVQIVSNGLFQSCPSGTLKPLRNGLESLILKMHARERLDRGQRYEPIVSAVIACGLLFGSAAQAAGPIGDYSGLPKDLAAAAAAYDLAQYKSDRAELERLLAEDYVLAGTNGRKETKAQYIADATAPGSKTLSVVISQQVKRVWPNGAVLGGMVDATGLDHGKRFTIRARFVDVWARLGGRWRVIFTQAEKVH